MKEFDFFENNPYTKQIYIFGAGYYGNLAILYAKENSICVAGCFDNDITKQGTYIFSGIKCLKPTKVDLPIVITVKNKKVKEDIKKQLIELGNENIYCVDCEKLLTDMFRISDKYFLEFRFYKTFNKMIDWDNPKTYNEKLQWLKLNDRKPLYSVLADKYLVKKYVAEMIGEQYIIPTLGVWNNFDEIDFDVLPESFVLKCTHDSGSIEFVDNKDTLDLEGFKEKFTSALNIEYWRQGREWAYKNVSPKIIAEARIEYDGKPPIDYKFFCFNGVAKAMFIATNRHGAEADFDFFDREQRWMDLRHGHPNSSNRPDVPVNFEKMVALAEKLSKGIKHVRIDFYEIKGKIYFGEYTFYHHAGFVPFDPPLWDEIFGSWIDISDRTSVHLL